MINGGITMKRFVLAVLTAVAFVALSVVPVFAADVAIEVSTAEASPGDSVTLTFTISGNPGIAAYSADLIYDQSALELTAAASGKDLRALTFIKYIPNNRIAAFSANNTTKNGVMFSATFLVKDGAKAGLAPVTLSVTEMVSADYVYYTPTITSGGVTVVNDGTGESPDAESPGDVPPDAADDPTPDGADAPGSNASVGDSAAVRDPVTGDDPTADDEPATADEPTEDGGTIDLEQLLTNDIFTGNGVDIDVEDIFEAMGIERDPSVPPPSDESGSQGEVLTGAEPIGKLEQSPTAADVESSGVSPAVWIIPLVVVACAAGGAYIIIYKKKHTGSEQKE